MLNSDRKNRRQASHLAEKKRSFKKRDTAQRVTASAIPHWISAVSAFGIFGLALYGAFFSNLSQVLIEELTDDNRSLRDEALGLGQKLSEERSELMKIEDQRLKTESDLRSLAELYQNQLTESENADRKLADTEAALETLNQNIGSARIELETLYNELQEVSSDAFRLRLQRLTGNTVMPEYLRRYTFVEHNERSQGFRVFTIDYGLDEIAYGELLDELDKVIEISTSDRQVKLAEKFQSNVLSRCPSSTDFESRVMEGITKFQTIEINRTSVGKSNEEISNDLQRLEEVDDLYSDASFEYLNSITSALSFCIDGK